MLKSDKTGMKDALIMSAIIGTGSFFIFVLFATGAFFSDSGARNLILEKPAHTIALAIVIFLATFGLSLPITVGMAFRSSTKDE